MTLCKRLGGNTLDVNVFENYLVITRASCITSQWFILNLCCLLVSLIDILKIVHIRYVSCISYIRCDIKYFDICI